MSDAQPTVHLFEEHSSTLPIWWQAEGHPFTVVYLDAHLDLQQVDEHKLESLRACGTLEEVRALEAPHHLNPSPDYAFGIENFLYPAARLGLVERLVWVAPPHIPRGYSHAVLDYMQQMDGITFDELTGFQGVAKGAIRGTLMGLDITICGYDSLSTLDLPRDYVLDIDVDYFVEVPADRLWCDPADVLERILADLGAPRFTTISRAVGSGFTPLELRFLGELCESVVRNDAAGKQISARLVRALELRASGQRESADSLLSEIPEEGSLGAATCYLRATLADGDEATMLRERAGQLDAGYRPELSREASAFPHRRKKMAREQLQALDAALDALPPGDPERPFATIALGQLNAAAGKVGRAWDLLQELEGDFAWHGDVLLGIAAAMLKGDEADKAGPMLKRASGYDKIRSQSLLYLGDLAYRRGNGDLALASYRQVAERAPAWMLPLERLALCYRSLDDTDALASVEAEIARRKQVMERLLDTSPAS